MTWLSPLGFLWLCSVPVLLWLWRLAATHRQVRIPSLVPFEHLLRRAPTRRTRLVVNLLFWLQLAALLFLTLALARPVWWQRRARTVLVLLDTSASLGAEGRGVHPFAQAKRALRAALHHPGPATQWFLMATSPVGSLTPQPTSDPVVLSRAIEEARVAHLGGNLATTARLGRALLGQQPDETLIVTDEEPPPGGAGASVRWIGVGSALPNVALVGLEAQGSLCQPAEPRVLATVQNFAETEQTVQVVATSRDRRLAEVTAALPPQGRQPISLALPESFDGWVEVAVHAPQDGLATDNRAWLELHRTATLPIVVNAASESLTQTVSRWLEACPALQWRAAAPAPDGNTPAPQPALVISDQEAAAAGASVALLFVLPSRPEPVVSSWVVASDHPLGSYLAQVERVSAALTLSRGPVGFGTPVIDALVDGLRVPVVVAEERPGQRRVFLYLDPAASEGSTPVLLAFLNSLRWLMGLAASQTTGEPLRVPGLRPGLVELRRPDGSLERVPTDGGVLQASLPTLAGRYRVSQGSMEREIAVNFFDPIESNLTHRASTWLAPHVEPAGAVAPRKTAFPLSRWLVALALVLALVEWWRYSTKQT